MRRKIFLLMTGPTQSKEGEEQEDLPTAELWSTLLPNTSQAKHFWKGDETTRETSQATRCGTWSAAFWGTASDVSTREVWVATYLVSNRPACAVRFKPLSPRLRHRCSVKCGCWKEPGGLIARFHVDLVSGKFYGYLFTYIMLYLSLYYSWIAYQSHEEVALVLGL